MQDNYLKLSRKIIKWKYFDNHAYTVVWIYLLCRANFKKGYSMGIQLNAGQLYESYSSISKKTNTPVSTVRRIIQKLKVDNQISTEVSNHGLIITILNWDTYQSKGNKSEQASEQANEHPFEQPNGQPNEQASEHQSEECIKECIKNDKERNKERYKKDQFSDSVIVDAVTKHHYGENGNVLLTEVEYNKLHIDYPNADELINYLDLYIPDKAYKSKSHYSAIKRWVIDAVKKKDSKLSNSEKFAQGKRAF